MKRVWPLLVFVFVALVIIVGGWFMPYATALLPMPTGFGEGKWQELGQRADFFGGFVNPLLSFLAFMGVLYSISLQRADLRESQVEAQRQQFENTFFQMLSVHNRIIEGIDLGSQYEGEPPFHGRDCFKEYFRRLNNHIRDAENAHGPTPLQKIQTGYRVYWEKSRQDLGHYYRFLYNFIRYVDQANLPQLKYDEADPKVKYTRIIRAQLSDFELALIFYNALGDHGGKFRDYVGKYDLLDNLTQDIMERPHDLDHREDMGHVGPLHVIPPPAEAK